MKNCAFLTMADPSGFFIYDQLTEAPLRELGWTVQSVPWTADNVDWDQFDAVVIRSTWDYQNAPDQFLATLDRIDQTRAKLFNSSRICRWNLEKNYLRDLESRGVTILPTEWFESLDASRLQKLLDHLRPQQRLVLKPIVGANADNVFVLSPGQQDDLSQSLEFYANRPVMVQPFLESIKTRGECSLFYFDGEYSHSILKRPKPGDFRVQEEHGGSISPMKAGDELRQTGDAVITAVGERLLYARVDLVWMDDGSPVLIELELIEPSLYFNCDEDSPTRFAAALDRMMS